MKKLFATVILSGIAAVLSAGSPLFEKDVVFHISFDDQTIEADITEGSEKPQSKFGKVAFADGISGKALRCGKDGAKVRFHRPDNLNFDRPGTIVFFYKGVGWKTFGKGSRVLSGQSNLPPDILDSSLPTTRKHCVPASVIFSLCIFTEKRFRTRPFSPGFRVGKPAVKNGTCWHFPGHRVRSV